mgnify:CR=1 FL=1
MSTAEPDSLGLLLHDARRAVVRRFEARAASHGLSSAQWRLLFALKRLGPCTQARLAERLEIEPISVSRLIDRAEEAGWVTREADPADRRSNVERLIGESALVMEPVSASGGLVKIGGDVWSARSETGVLSPGQHAIVSAIDGATAVVVPQPETAVQ